MTNNGQLSKRNKLQDIDGSLSSPSAKGERLRRVRHLANLSREEFCSDGEINLTTLISWEIGRFGGLSAKGAQRVIARVAKEGVFCAPEWLLYEIGVGPEVRTDYKKANQVFDAQQNNHDFSDENAAIIEEIMLFRKNHRNSVDLIIEDDGMLPHYQIGDYVAGIKRSGEKIKSLIGFDCIVQAKNGQIMLRNLQPGPRLNSFNLVCTNLLTKTTEAISYDIEIANAAPIIWHRKKDPI